MRNVDIETMDTILLVGLFPTLSEDYNKYTRNFDSLNNSITSANVDPQRNKMINYISTILKTRYNPKLQDAKVQRTFPRDMKWIKFILSGKEATFPKSYFHIVWAYSLARFDETQCKIFNVLLPYFSLKTHFITFSLRQQRLENKKAYSMTLFLATSTQVGMKLIHVRHRAC